MLAHELGDALGHARLEYFRGFSEFEQDDFSRAVRHHQAAEDLYTHNGYTGTPRTLNLQRLFLCARQRNDLREAEEVLRKMDSVAAASGRAGPAHHAQALNYRGYAHLYVDPARAMPLWRSAYETAREHGLREMAAKCLMSCGYLAVLLDDLEQADLDFLHADEEIRGLDGATLQIRLHLDRGILHMVRGRLGDARLELEEGSRQAVKYGIFRRMWRLDANLATLFEALGDPARTLVYDARSYAGWRVRAAREEPLGAAAPWLHQRHALPAVNTALRARQGSDAHERMIASLPTPQRREVERLADMMETAPPASMPGALHHHVKWVHNRLRGLVTE
jgi:tetratricopeptide (TPR) repeat protein